MVFAEASLLIRGQKPPAATRLHLVRHRGAMTDLLAKSPDQVIQGERERERESESESEKHAHNAGWKGRGEESDKSGGNHLSTPTFDPDTLA